MIDYNNIKDSVSIAATELINSDNNLKENDIFFVGCSTSEVAGFKIGSNSNLDIAKYIFDGIYEITQKNKLILAVGCCEHLNRAIVTEKSASILYNLEIVNVIPQINAGGAFATYSYNNLNDSVAVDKIKASLGMDIGGTLIGMNLKQVAVPVKTSISHIGNAPLICARSRPKFVGGNRAVYDKNLL